MGVKATDIVEAARKYVEVHAPYRFWTGAYPEYGPPGYMDATKGAFSPAFVKREGVHCAGLINLARAECGLEPIGLTKQYYDWVYDTSSWFDPNTPGVPGAICVHSWEAGVTEGHVSMISGSDGHTIIQATPNEGVWEGDTDYNSNLWAEYQLYSLMPDVDYGDVPPLPASGALTAEMLVRAMTSNSFAGPDIDPAYAALYLSPLTAACVKYGITNRARLSAFLAQTGAESGSFRWWREFGGEDREFAPYYGRGPLQMTFRSTYQRFQDATGYQVVDNPDLVATDPQIGFDSAAWFWRHGNGDLNDLADIASWPAFYEITSRVWGITPPQPVAERDMRYQVAWDALPADLDLSVSEPTPDPEPQPTPITIPKWIAVNSSGYLKTDGGDYSRGWWDIADDGSVGKWRG